MYVIKRSLAVALALPLLLSFSACGDKEKKPEADEKQAEAPKVENKDPATLFTGDAVTMPPVYGALKPGMTQDQAKQAMADLPEDGTIKSEAYPDIWFYADFDKDTKKLRRVYFRLPKADAVKYATEKWGEPKQGTERDKKILWWFNPKDNLRVSVADDSGDEAQVEFTYYWPVAQLLGEDKDIAFEKHAPLLGLTVAELEAKYPEWLEKKSEEETKKTQEGIAKLAGEDAKAVMGKPTGSMHLDFPPTEWGSYWTRVNLSWSEEGKIERYRFGIEFEPHPPAKDEIFALLKKKWGEPKQEEPGDKVFVFSEEPRIEVEENTISNKWDVTVEAPKG